MSYQAILEYLVALEKIYFIESKEKKSNLLDHASQITSLHRKTIIRKLRKKIPLINRKSNRGAKSKYLDTQLLPHIRFLWISMERISAKRMKAALPHWLPYYKNSAISHEIKIKLLEMSSSTLDRFLVKIRREIKATKGLSSTSPARHMKNKVPINTLDSIITTPGHLQADTVAHCGNTLLGNFMNTVTVTDIHSTWTVNRAIYTKKGNEVKEVFNHLRKDLPFTIKAVNTDSGSEFLNTPVVNNFAQKNINFTRSRPYKKNDNCYVEQKNFTHVRELFGYERIDNIELKDLMNEIYELYWNPLQNFFLPTFKLQEKVRIGAKIKKKYDQPKTPYQRLIDSKSLSEFQKNKLNSDRENLNPFNLKIELEKKLNEFFILLNKSTIRKEAA